MVANQPTEHGDARRLTSRQLRRRQAIVDTALEMLETRTHEQLQMRDISQECDVALATLYRHFPSKELLLARVFEEWCEGYWKRLSRAPRGPANLDRLVELSSRSVDAYASQPSIFELLTMLELSSDPDVAAVMHDVKRRAKDFFLGALDGVDPDDASQIVDIVFAVLSAQLRQWVRGAITIRQAHAAMSSAARLLLEYRDPTSVAAPTTTRPVTTRPNTGRRAR